MSLNISGHSVEVTPALRTYTTEKFEKLNKRGDHITSINVILAIEKLQQIAKATVHVSGAEIHAHSESTNLYTAIDALVDKLSHQIIKHKEKIKEHRVNGHSEEQ